MKIVCQLVLTVSCAVVVDAVFGGSAFRAGMAAVDESETKSSPSERFDLSHWKLTLPVSSRQQYDGHPREVSAVELMGGFRNSHFYLSPGGEMTFWCPVTGARTEGTKYPRSELREMLEPGNPRLNWAFPGTHRLTGRCRMLQVPSYSKVVIGQIHGYSGEARPLVKLQHFKGRIEALVKLSPHGGRDRKLTFRDVQPESAFDWVIELSRGVLSITVGDQTQSENMLKHDKAWSHETFYFKVGAYVQDNEGGETEGGRVAFSRVQVEHAP